MDTTVEMYQAIVAFFLPVIISTIIKPTWGENVKYWVSFLIVFIAAMVEVWFSGEFVLTNIPITMLKTLALVTGSYLIFWRPSGIAKAIQNKVGVK